MERAAASTEERAAVEKAWPSARQGHAYSWRGNRVIAMESGAFPRVSYIDPAWQSCSPPFHVKAEELTPEPMAYFHGEVPR